MSIKRQRESARKQWQELPRDGNASAVEDPIDRTTAQSRARTTLLATFGDMEAEMISVRVKAAREQLIEAGRRVGGRRPGG